MIYVEEVCKADEFNPDIAICHMKTNVNRPLTKYEESICDSIKSHQNPVAPPSNMKLFSERLEEVDDMRHFMFNRYAGPVKIISIDSGYLWSGLNTEQTELYKMDNNDGVYPHDPGLFWARNMEGRGDKHHWESVPNQIEDALYTILYWMKFTELTGIKPNMSHLNGSAKLMYEYIQDHKEELMRGYTIIASSELYV